MFTKTLILVVLSVTLLSSNGVSGKSLELKKISKVCSKTADDLIEYSKLIADKTVEEYENIKNKLTGLLYKLSGKEKRDKQKQLEGVLTQLQSLGQEYENVAVSKENEWNQKINELENQLENAKTQREQELRAISVDYENRIVELKLRAADLANSLQ